ncbi:MAG: DUF1697 domain-containing protein [Pseudomonadota bacterium]
MNSYVALLRAVNVGGTGRLSMKDLVSLAARAGLMEPQTYIQSGNLVFRSDASETELVDLLEAALKQEVGLATNVLVRTWADLTALHNANPFPDAAPNQLGILFLPTAWDGDPLAGAGGVTDELVAMAEGSARREIYVHFPSGMGKSRLRLDAMKDPRYGGTMRNLNTVRKLIALSA